MAGQAKLLDSKVLLLGAGGLGSPAALYLAAAGVGTIGIVDMDEVDASNLQRQILHNVDRIGERKVDSAKKTLTMLNPDVNVVAHDTRLSADNVLDLIDGYDVIVDGADNFPVRYLLNDASLKKRIPVVHGSIFRFEGQATVFNPYKGPCYRCMIPEPPPAELAPSCAEAGVLGVLPGIVGSIQALEAIKLILDLGDSLSGRLLAYDAMEQSFRTFKVLPRPRLPGLLDRPRRHRHRGVRRAVHAASGALTRLVASSNSRAIPMATAITSRPLRNTMRRPSATAALTHQLLVARGDPGRQHHGAGHVATSGTSRQRRATKGSSHTRYWGDSRGDSTRSRPTATSEARSRPRWRELAKPAGGAQPEHPGDRDAGRQQRGDGVLGPLRLARDAECPRLAERQVVRAHEEHAADRALDLVAAGATEGQHLLEPRRALRRAATAARPRRAPDRDLQRPVASLGPQPGQREHGPGLGEHAEGDEDAAARLSSPAGQRQPPHREGHREQVDPGEDPSAPAQRQQRARARPRHCAATSRRPAPPQPRGRPRAG